MGKTSSKPKRTLEPSKPSKDLITLNNIKTCEKFSLIIKSAIILKNNKLAVSSLDRTIRIFDPSNNYNCDEIKHYDSSVLSICQTEDGSIVASCSKGAIYIGEYIIKSAHADEIWKVVSLSNNRIASCSLDKNIKIWKSDPPYNDTPITVFTLKNAILCIYYIKEKELLISGGDQEPLRFWSLNSYQCVTVIADDVFCIGSNAIYQIDKDKIIVGVNFGFSFVNIEKCKLEKTVDINTHPFCFVKLRNNKIIVCGCSDGYCCVYNTETKKYTLINSNHLCTLNALVNIDEHTFASCSQEIRIWNY